MKQLASVIVAIALGACGNIARSSGDAGPHDAAPDTPTDTQVDGAIDAAAPTEAREVVNGGGRMTSATYSLDVQIGHGFTQNQTSGATYTLEGNAAVKP